MGDTGRYPYGPRPLDEVRDFALQIGTWLVDHHDVEVLVVACNTAAAAALDELADRLGVPVVGVIEPGVRAMLSATRSGHVGVIGTVGTISSGAYQRTVARMADDVKLTCAACPGFVEFVERGDLRGDQVHVLAERLLAPLQDAGVDTLLLGCTHYPYLARTIADVMGRDVVLVSSADETAFALAAELEPDRRPTDRSARRRATGGSRRVTWAGSVPGPPAAGPRAGSGRGPGRGTTAAGAAPMSLQMTVLGCSGSYPGPEGACSGYLVQGGGANVVIDLGPGSLANLQRHLALRRVDAVILTHRHPDHWTDLAGLHVALKYGSDATGPAGVGHRRRAGPWPTS